MTPRVLIDLDALTANYGLLREAAGRARAAYLTHMDHSMDYATLKAKLPANVEPAYDELVVEW